MARKTATIRWKLIRVISILLIVVCGGIAVLSTLSGQAAIEETIEESLIEIATDSAKYIRARLDYLLLGIENIAAQPQMKSMDWEIQEPILEEESNRLGYLGMGIVFPDGHAVYTDGNTANLGDRTYVKDAFSGKTVISDVIISRVTHKAVVMLASPIFGEGGKPVAVIIARLDGEELSLITDNISYGEDGYSYIVNGEADIIAHPNRDYVFNSKNFIKESEINPEYVQMIDSMNRMVARETGFDRYRLDGIDRFLGFAPIESTDWSIVIVALKDEVMTSVRGMSQNILIVFFASILVGIFVSIWFSLGISKPIRNVMMTLSEMSNGNLTDRVNVKSRDEVGQMSRSLNDTLENLTGFITTIRLNLNQTIDGVNKLLSAMNDTKMSASEISTLAEDVKSSIIHQSSVVVEVSSTVEEIARTIENQDGKIESQSASITESSAAIEQMIANIKSISNGLKNNSMEFEKLNDVVDSGNTLVGELKETVLSLWQQSQSVMEANEVIMSIASQTNLLAMNAAIEAAHAGEAGRGFAVVADEIRKLAEVSNDQSRLISDSLGIFKKAIDEAVGASRDTEESLGAIVQSVQRVTNIEEEIKISLEEQSSGGSQVLMALSDISRITEEVHSGSREMLTGSRAIIQEMTGLVEITEKVKDSVLSVAEKSKDVDTIVLEAVDMLNGNTASLNAVNEKVAVFQIEKEL